MFENIICQEPAALLTEDITGNTLPGSLFFYGGMSFGKFSTALETARVMSCRGSNRGFWNCPCSACSAHRALLHTDLIVDGYRDCTPEINAAFIAFIKAVKESAAYLETARYFFIRSVRKLTMRFNPVVWQDEKDIGKIAPLIFEIDELIENIDFPHNLPELSEIEKTFKKIIVLCVQLEKNYLKSSIPISHIRNINSWSRLKSSGGKKTVILENADKMLDSARNALLKILEEPPEDTVFILIAEVKNSLLPTILSRVRGYKFTQRSLQQEHEVIDRVFHAPEFAGSINEYLLSFMDVTPEMLKTFAMEFFTDISNNEMPDIAALIKKSGSFQPAVTFKIFLENLMLIKRNLLANPVGTAVLSDFSSAISKCFTEVSAYNISKQSSLENLASSLIKINKTYGGVF